MPDNEPPAAAPHWHFWASLLWGLLIVVVFLTVQSVVAIAVFAVRGGGAVDEASVLAEDGTLLYAATIATAVIGCTLIAIIIRLKKGAQIADYLAITPVPAKTMVKWLAALAGLILLSDLLAIAFGRPIVPSFMANVYTTAYPVWLLWVALIVAAPLFEEVFFRGFLYRGLAASFLRPAGAVIVISALWTAAHLQYGLFELGAVFVLGLLLGAARAMTGSILTPVTLHATANLVATIETAMVV